MTPELWQQVIDLASMALSFAFLAVVLWLMNRD